MCGIAGIVLREAGSAPALRAAIRRMGARQIHRGPDGWGEWLGAGVALGHNRLAILDLPGGVQPMGNEDGTVWVVFNGEIYNHRELRAQLIAHGHRFRSDHSDTEVLVHGFEQWGTGLFEKLEGMFGVAIWDERAGQLVLARDRLGIKPVYYAPAEGGLVFASEPKAVLASGLVPPNFRAHALPDYFFFRAARGPDTLLDGVAKLPPGCFLVCDRMRPREPVPYWRPAARVEGDVPVVAWGERLLETLGSAASSHLISDVPVGLFLSGGVDSSLLGALVARAQRIEAFTVGVHGPLDETPFARKVAEHVGIPLHVRLVTARDFSARLDDWLYVNDDPVADPSALALMLLSEFAREHGMKVMLAGEGADELFGGYTTYLRYAFFSAAARLPGLGPLRRALGRRLRGRSSDYLLADGPPVFLGTAHVMDGPTRRALFDEALAERIPEWERSSFDAAGGEAPLRRAMLFDQAVRLPNDLLPRTDRATMAASIEGRVPYLDRRVVELANGLPDDLCVRLRTGECKWLLKRVAATQVPPEVVFRRKVGFDLPVGEWLAGEFRERMLAYLAAGRVPGLAYGFLRTLYQRHLEGDDAHTALLWSWLVLEEWYRRWIEGGASVPPAPAGYFEAAVGPEPVPRL